MTPSVKFVIDFENPRGHIQILGDQLCERVNELLFIIDVNAADWGWHISQLEDLFRS